MVSRLGRRHKNSRMHPRGVVGRIPRSVQRSEACPYFSNIFTACDLPSTFVTWRWAVETPPEKKTTLHLRTVGRRRLGCVGYILAAGVSHKTRAACRRTPASLRVNRTQRANRQVSHETCRAKHCIEHLRHFLQSSQVTTTCKPTSHNNCPKPSRTAMFHIALTSLPSPLLL